MPEIRARAAAAVAEAKREMLPVDLPEHHCHGFWSVLQQPLSRALVDSVLALDDVAALTFVAANPTTPPDVVAALLGHPATEVRRRLATRGDLTGAQLARLAADPEVAVRTQVSVHPGLTEAQRSEIAIDVTTADGHGHDGPWHRCRRPGHAPGDEQPPAPADAPGGRAGRVRRRPRPRAAAAGRPRPAGRPGRRRAAVRRSGRHRAPGHGRLPAARCAALLDDPELAGYAAANPALPADRAARILRGGPG